MKESGVWLDDFDPSGIVVFVTQFEYFFLDLKRFEIGELNKRWDGFEKRLIYCYLGIGVDREIRQI